jgi:hypothetical protein
MVYKTTSVYNRAIITISKKLTGMVCYQNLFVKNKKTHALLLMHMFTRYDPILLFIVRL